MIKLLFSWDDGSIYDLKLANLMLKYNIKAMFFIPTTNWEHPYIKKSEIRELYNLGMEIGGHTVSHRYLTKIPQNQAEIEIRDNKFYLEDIIGDSVDIFCYPGGFYNKYIENVAKKYYKRARSAKTMRFNIQNSFTVDTSFHFYKRGITSILKNAILNDITELISILTSLTKDTFISYKNIIKNLSKKNKDYIIHIWGHGWEIEKYNLWGELEDFLKFLSELENIKFTTNKEVYL